MKKLIKGQPVRVSGEVKYGRNYYRVASRAVVVDAKHGAYALCTVDSIDGDQNVNVMVRKRIITPATEPKRARKSTRMSRQEEEQ